MSIAKLLHGLDSLDLRIQQLGVDLLGFMLNMKKKFGHAFVSNKEGQNRKPVRSTLTYVKDLMSVKSKNMMITKVLVRYSSS